MLYQKPFKILFDYENVLFRNDCQQKVVLEMSDEFYSFSEFYLTTDY